MNFVAFCDIMLINIKYHQGGKVMLIESLAGIIGSFCFDLLKDKFNDKADLKNLEKQIKKYAHTEFEHKFSNLSRNEEIDFGGLFNYLTGDCIKDVQLSLLSKTHEERTTFRARYIEKAYEASKADNNEKKKVVDKLLEDITAFIETMYENKNDDKVLYLVRSAVDDILAKLDIMDGKIDTLNNKIDKLTEEQRVQIILKESEDYKRLEKEIQELQNIALENPSPLLSKMIEEKINEIEALKNAIYQLWETIQKFKGKSPLAKKAEELFKQRKFKESRDLLAKENIGASERAKSIKRQRDYVIENANNELSEISINLVLQARATLADIGDTVRFAKAENLFEKALDAYRSPDTLFSYAKYLQEQNDFKNALPLYTEALDIIRKLALTQPEAYEPDVATTLNNIAVLHDEQGKLDQAEAEHTEALEIRRRLALTQPEAYEPNVATTLNNIAVLHDEQGKFDQAEAEYTEALEIRRRLALTQPEAYEPDVAMTLNNIAVLHKNQGKFDQAEAECGEALGIFRRLASKHFGAYSKKLVSVLENLKLLYAIQNRENETLELIQEIEEIKSRM